MPLVMIFSQIVSGNHVISQFPLAKSILLGKKEIYFFIFYVGWEKTNLQKKQTKPVKVLQPQLPSPQKKHKKQKKTHKTHTKKENKPTTTTKEKTSESMFYIHVLNKLDSAI